MAKRYWGFWRVPLIVAVVALGGGTAAWAVLSPTGGDELSGASGVLTAGFPGQMPAPADPAAPTVRLQPEAFALAEEPAVDCDKVNCVALTFDDGPGEYGDALLDLLAEKNARATFFYLGPPTITHAEMVNRAAADGHAIGSHAARHVQMTEQGPAGACENAATGGQAIEAIGLPAPVLLRPPYGAINGAIVAACPQWSFVLWNVDTMDWSTKDAVQIMERVRLDTKPGSIILMHETVEAELTAVPLAIDWLRANGFVLVTVPELFGGQAPAGERVYGGPAPTVPEVTPGQATVPVIAGSRLPPDTGEVPAAAG
ncbi:MAG: polysaccharide deacetylase family protein [Micrococcales bacterium]|nr:polysaccharide deacetylase family protein [Micrococcales bacterium]